MKRFRFYAILIAMVAFVACSDDFEPQLTTDLDTDTFMFESQGGEQSFMLESNEQWSVGDLPEWLTVKVTDTPATRAQSKSYESGKKTVTITAKANSEYEERSVALVMMSVSGKTVNLTVKQEKKTKLITDLDSDEITFSSEGGVQSFLLESNEEWTISDLPSWLTVSVKEPVEGGTRSTFYESGKKDVAFTAEKNTEYVARSTNVVLTSLKGVTIELKVVQEKKPELVGYWILSEGYTGSNNSEMAWYDASTGVLAKKQFKVINGKALGDTGNALKLYGSKMYAVMSGPGFGDSTPEGTSYIEVIDPKTGISIKRIQFTNAKGMAAKPRNIIFEGGKGYVSSYSNELVRLDTATLELDARVALSGTLAEGLTYSDGNIYVCNSGQGEDNRISVVNAQTMTETKVIRTAMNPTGIVSAGNGVIYFSTNYPYYTLYKLTTADEKITEMQGLSVGDMTYTNNNIYTCSFDWETYMGEVYQFNTTTDTATPLNLDLAGVKIPMLMEYHIGTINGSEDIYLTGMGEDIVIFEPSTQKIKHAFKTNVANASGVVAVYK